MTRTRQASALALLATALLLVFAFVPREAFAQRTGPATPLATQLDYQQAGDSLRVIGRWFPRTDGAGAVDSVRYQWTVNGVVRAARTTRRLADTTMVPRALCPTLTQLVLTVTPFRRTDVGVPVTRTTAAGCRILIPAIDSVVIDTGHVFVTALRVDSTPAVHFSTWANSYGVRRADSLYVRVDVLYDGRTYAVLGAQVSAPVCSDGARWTTGDTASVRLQLARAAQWPRDSLTARAFRTYKAADLSRAPALQAWQQRCA